MCGIQKEWGEKSSQMQSTGTSLAVWWLRLHTPSARGPGLILSQGTRFHMLQLRGLHAATETRFSKISYAITKMQCSQIYIYAAAKTLQSCPILCDPIDGSPPGSPVPGILQARILEWVAISFSNA